MSEDPARVEGSSPARAGEAARELIRRTRQVTRRKFPAEEKIRILLEGIRGEVTVSELCRREGLHPTTYYRWQRRFRQQGEVGLVDRRPQPGAVWNRLRPQEEETILQEGLHQPDLSPREVACWVTDHAGFSVSESSVYRVLKRHGLIREVEVVGFPAGQIYQVKTTRTNEQWQSDAS